VLITDSGTDKTNWAVGASFLAGTGTTTFTASVLSDTTLEAWKQWTDNAEAVLSAWTFSTDYAVSSSAPLYLSFKVGPGQSRDALVLWAYDGSDWSPYTPTDLTYDGTYASFTATSVRGFAVTTPEPGTFALFAIGLLGLATYARARRKRG
jgi:hypothetical protein